MQERVRARSDRWGSGLRRDVREAIERVWPNGVVEMSFDPDESYFSRLQPKLSRALGRIGNTCLVYDSVKQKGGPCGGRSPILKRTRRTKSGEHVLFLEYLRARLLHIT